MDTSTTAGTTSSVLGPSISQVGFTGDRAYVDTQLAAMREQLEQKFTTQQHAIAAIQTQATATDASVQVLGDRISGQDGKLDMILASLANLRPPREAGDRSRSRHREDI